MLLGIKRLRTTLVGALKGFRSRGCMYSTHMRPQMMVLHECFTAARFRTLNTVKIAQEITKHTHSKLLSTVMPSRMSTEMLTSPKPLPAIGQFAYQRP